MVILVQHREVVCGAVALLGVSSECAGNCFIELRLLAKCSFLDFCLFFKYLCRKVRCT